MRKESMPRGTRGGRIELEAGRPQANTVAAPTDHLSKATPPFLPAGSRVARTPASVLVDDQLLTIDEWCAHNRISRRTYYNLQRDGQGPELTRIRGAVRISREANRRWRKRMAKRRPSEGSKRPLREQGNSGVTGSSAVEPLHRKRGPEPTLRLGVKKRMLEYNASHGDLATLKEEVLGRMFGASRYTCRRARKDIFENPEIRNSDNLEHQQSSDIQ
jgi:hypothetical protein